MVLHLYICQFWEELRCGGRYDKLEHFLEVTFSGFFDILWPGHVLAKVQETFKVAFMVCPLILFPVVVECKFISNLWGWKHVVTQTYNPDRYIFAIVPFFQDLVGCVSNPAFIIVRK